MSYSLSLPAWSIGEDCYQEIYGVTRMYGTKVAVIGGKTALAEAAGAIANALVGTDMSLSEPIWYGGNATFENVEMLEAVEAVRACHMIFAVGGGRAVDTCKVVADRLHKPLFTFPTLASNCAGCTTIAIMYHLDGVFRETYYSERGPVHCFLNSAVIARSPEKFLWAGIGDSIAKEYESELASRGRALPNTPAMGVMLARSVTKSLKKHGLKAMELIRDKRVGPELEECVLAIVITAGLVSAMTISDDEGKSYYYNASAAHVFYYAATAIPRCGKRHIHGELVAYGILVLMAMDGQWEKLKEFQKFAYAMKLPLTMEQIDLRAEDLPACAAKAAGGSVHEWGNWPYKVSQEMFEQAILDADRCGREFLAAVG